MTTEQANQLQYIYNKIGDLTGNSVNYVDITKSSSFSVAAGATETKNFIFSECKEIIGVSKITNSSGKDVTLEGISINGNIVILTLKNTHSGGAYSTFINVIVRAIQ